MFLQLKNIRKMYDENNGVKSLSLSIEKGEFITILGPSGCGKTTTLNMLGGFLKADGGQILLDGEDITDLSPDQRPISTVFQSYALFPHMNVIENVAYGIRYMGHKSKKEAKEIAREYLKAVDLTGYETSRVGALSGGQQQRVALARSMATNPKILLLDEPLSNLDAGLRNKMRQELKALQRKLGITMIYVTHDQEEALNIADKIAIMNQGELVQYDTPEAVYFKPSNDFVRDFLGISNRFHSTEGEEITCRPENLMFSETDGLEGEIVSAQFLGFYRLYGVRLDGGEEVMVRSSSDQKKPVGERVRIALK